MDLLRQGDPQNPTILRQALTILLRDEQAVAELGTIARERLRTTVPTSATFQLWLTVLMEVDAEAALTVLENTLAEAPSADDLMVRVCGPSAAHLAVLNGCCPSRGQPISTLLTLAA